MSMHYLGVDWGVEQHGLCLMGSDGRVLSEMSIPHSSEGFETLKSLLTDFDKVAINIETNNGLLVDWLSSQEHSIYVTTPTVVARRRPRRSKDDRGDAFLLANLLRTNDPDCRPLVHQSCTVVHLQQIIKAYDDVVEEKKRDAARLTWTLRKYYPSLLKAFRTRYSLTALAFLEAYPTPEAARTLSRVELAHFLKDQQYSMLKQKLGHIYHALQAATPTAYAEEGYVEAALILIPRLRLLIEQRKQLQKRIVEVFKTHPEAAWWRSLPGTSGPLTPARLLAAIGDDRKRFPSAKVLQATAGTAPITRRSGKQLRVEFRQACSKPLRKAITDFARLSIPKSGWAQAYFYEQIALGHSMARAHRALANRWLSVIWKLWHTGEIYDEARHVADRARRGQPLPVMHTALPVIAS
jgi:transposase